MSSEVQDQQFWRKYIEGMGCANKVQASTLIESILHIYDDMPAFKLRWDGSVLSASMNDLGVGVKISVDERGRIILHFDCMFVENNQINAANLARKIYYSKLDCITPP